MTRGGVLRKLAAAGIVTIATVGLTDTAASAHLDIVTTDPADGSVLTTSPERITLTFSGDLDPQLVAVELRTAAGEQVSLGAVSFDGGHDRLVVVVPPLVDDVYRLSYDVHDPIDLHRTSGSVVFGVGTSPLSVGGEDPHGAQVVESACEWAARGGLALVLGGLLITVLARRRAPVGRARDGSVATAIAVASVGAVLVVLGGLAALVVQTLDLGGPILSTLWRVLTASDYGRRFVVTAVVGCGLVRLLHVARPLLRTRPGSGDRAVNVAEVGALGCAAALVVLAAFSAHAGIGGSFAVGVVLRSAHLTAMGLWVGGLVVLVALRRRISSWERAALLRAFSPVAFVSVVVTAVTGLLLTGREVHSLTALMSTGFGEVLIVKLLVLGGALALGVRHAAAVRHGRHVAARTVWLEAVAALLVVLGGAALATAAPAVGERFEPAEVAPATGASQKVDDLLVRLTIGPSRPGRNLIRVELIDSRRPAPASAVSAQVVITDAAGSSVSTAGGPPHDGVIDLPAVDIAAPGPLRVRVEVDRPSHPLDPVEFEWVVEAAPAVRAPTVLSDDSLAPWCVAAALIVLLGATVTWSRRHRHSGTDRPDGPHGRPPRSTSEWSSRNRTSARGRSPSVTTEPGDDPGDPPPAARHAAPESRPRIEV